MPERLGEPHVPDAGDEPLVDERLADESRLIGAPQARDDRATCSVVGREQIGPELARPAASPNASTGPFHCVASHSLVAQDEPRQRRAAAGLRRCRTRQRPVMRRWLLTTTSPSKRRRRFFPTASDALEHAAVDRARDTRRQPARVRALGLDALTDEHAAAGARSDEGCRPRASASAVELSTASSRTALKIASENVGYGWIVSSRTSIGTSRANRERELAEPLAGLRPDRDGADEHAPRAIRRELHEAGPTRALVGREAPADDLVASRHDAVAVHARRRSRPADR